MSTVTYEELLAEALPAKIENDAQYDSIHGRLSKLLRKSRRTRAEDRLADLLSILVEDYDRRNSLPRTDDAPAERLRFLLQHSGRKPSELLPIFGQRSHVNEALNGKRAISLDQARKLAKMFSVHAGLFV